MILPCGADAGFRLRPQQFEAAITDRTRWLLLNSPSNPSGAAYRAADLALMAEVIRRHHRVWVISDDLYEHILHDGLEFATFAAVAPHLAHRTLTVNGGPRPTRWPAGT